VNACDSLGPSRAPGPVTSKKGSKRAVTQGDEGYERLLIYKVSPGEVNTLVWYPWTCLPPRHTLGSYSLADRASIEPLLVSFTDENILLSPSVHTLVFRTREA
jgi:hypothetical protein